MNRLTDIENYLGKIPLKNEIFVSKSVVGESLRRLRERARISESINHTTQRSIALRVWSVAASVLLLIFVAAGYRYSSAEYVTDRGQSLAVTLPDGSHVNLKEGSILKFNRIKWFFARNLFLEGKAMFEVTKGEKFSVVTRRGDISVLGTKFMVDQHAEEFSVECYEGSVAVSTPAGSTELGANEKAFLTTEGIVKSEIEPKEVLQDDESCDAVQPEYLSLENVPLSDAIDKIEEIYKVVIVPRSICEGVYFDGVILTSDLDAALRMVLEPCGIGYGISGGNVKIYRK